MDRRGEAQPLSRPLLETLWGRGGVRLLAGDAMVVLLFAALSVSLFFLPGRSRGPAGTARVQVGGREVATLDLAREGVSEVTGPLGVTRIETGGGQVRILSSPCPLKLCQRAGWVGAAGEMVVCLPNEVVVRLAGERRGVDALSR